MKRLSKEFLMMLKEKADIVSIARELGVKLSKSSDDRYSSPCPFPHHKDNNPSFSVFVDSKEFHCFGCHQHGDVVDLVRNITGASFFGSVKRVASMTGIELEEISEEDVAFLWEFEDDVPNDVSPDDIALFDIIDLRTTIQKIAERCGSGSDEFDSAFRETEELYERLEHATSPVIKSVISGKMRKLSSQLKESYLADDGDRGRPHGGVVSFRSYSG